MRFKSGPLVAWTFRYTSIIYTFNVFNTYCYNILLQCSGRLSSSPFTNTTTSIRSKSIVDVLSVEGAFIRVIIRNTF